MGTFTPIAMKCTKEQFNAVKPKLTNCEITDIHSFDRLEYLSNSYGGKSNCVSNIHSSSKQDNRVSYETWNEDIFLKACGIEYETLQEKAIRLENELKEVNKQIEEENNIKIGDWVKRTYKGLELFKADDTYDYRYINLEKHKYQKITNPELIKLLEQEIK